MKTRLLAVALAFQLWNVSVDFSAQAEAAQELPRPRPADAKPAPALRSSSPRVSPGYVDGRVVDSKTGEIINDFVIQKAPSVAQNMETVFWNHYFMGTGIRPGIFGFPVPGPEEMMRFVAPGYVPQIVTNFSAGTADPPNLEIRLVPGDMFTGVVVGDAGRPVAKARVLLATIDRVNLSNGAQLYGAFRGSSNLTDATGHFTLRGEGGPIQKVVILSDDGYFFWPALQTEPGKEWKITLPKPGTLIVRYNIPGDSPEAQPELYLKTPEMDQPLWRDLSFGLTVTVANGGQTVLTNLTPGTYHFRRYKPAENGGQGAETESQTILVAAGKTQYADMFRNGQRIHGIVRGPSRAMASGGTILVKSADATGQPWPQGSKNNAQEFQFQTFDVAKFGPDGVFQTGFLDPGRYSVIAEIYPPENRSDSGPHRNNGPDYVAVAKLTLSPDLMPVAELKLAPALYVDIEGSVVDDESGGVIPDAIVETGTVNPDPPGEIVWHDGYQGTYQGNLLLWAQKDGTAYRFQANGYVPEVLTRNEIIASRRTGNLRVRMKLGEELGGVVLDHGGRPVVEAKVYLAPLDLGFVRFGSTGSSSSAAGTVNYWAHTFASTDARGHFSMRGAGTNATRLIAVTDDGQMVQPANVAGPGKDLKITLPEPAALLVHYNIADDQAEASVDLTLRTNELDQSLWGYINPHVSLSVTNGGQIVLRNLLPGTYDFTRARWGQREQGGFIYVFGEPPTRVRTDTQKVVLASGQTQNVSLVHSGGQRVAGQVTGLEGFGNSAGAFLYVTSANAIASDKDYTKSRLDPLFDAASVGQDGHFQTSALEPGTYTFVVEVYTWSAPAPQAPVPDDEPQRMGGGFRMGQQQLMLVGSTPVTVLPGNVAPAPIKIEARSLLDVKAGR